MDARGVALRDPAAFDTLASAELILNFLMRPIMARTRWLLGLISIPMVFCSAALAQDLTPARSLSTDITQESDIADVVKQQKGIMAKLLAEVGSLLFDDVEKGDDLGFVGVFEHGGCVPAIGHAAATDKSELEHVDDPCERGRG